MRALRIDLSDVVVLRGRYGDPAWSRFFLDFAGTEHSEMGSVKKSTLPLKFKLPRILDLLTTYVDVSALVALSQYYDPPLRCFTFKDFQLVPTIEKYERLLGWYVKEHPPFTKLGELLLSESVAEALHLSIEKVTLGMGPKWFSRKFLEEKAWALEKEGKQLKQTEKECGDNHRWFVLAVKEKKNDNLGCLNEKVSINSLLDTYVGSINLLQPSAAMYRAKYDCLVRFCNELTKEVTWKLEDALEDAD
ncbi:hypothetical protein KIW84_022675 [Lathyrus oleraceus]|uniref:DUF7745 domain-containing protein n=1 Tax=Pisum sativum TaxID=3888 RepID=A0A9D4YB26_PEA|nr:hypothetical protein KIW84_022675 [Pisum sativum]